MQRREKSKRRIHRSVVGVALRVIDALDAFFEDALDVRAGERSLRIQAPVQADGAGVGMSEGAADAFGVTSNQRMVGMLERRHEAFASEHRFGRRERRGQRRIHESGNVRPGQKL